MTDEEKRRAVIDIFSGKEPEWVAVLRCARDWGIPPWEVERPGLQEWFERWKVLVEAEARRDAWHS